MFDLTSVELLTYAANGGVIEAQVALAVLHEHGVLVDQSYEKARSWYEKSAQRGSAFAMNQLALYLEKGRGGPASASDAFQWASDAAKREYRDDHLPDPADHRRAAKHQYRDDGPGCLAELQCHGWRVGIT